MRKEFFFFCLLFITSTLSSLAIEDKKEISEIDQNFRPATITGLDVHFYNAFQQPFSLEGFPWRKPEGAILRLPETFTEKEINKGALFLAHHSAGGVIRFRSDSPYLALRAKLAYSFDMNHMPRTGSAGFDLYRDGKFVSVVQPPSSFGTIVSKLTGADNGKICNFSLNLPLYGSAAEIEIGIAPGSRLLPPLPHKIAKPILFHGSSITQGGCASRPGNVFTSMLCREFDVPQINLGFSGSGMAEPALAEAVSKLELSLLVLDAGHSTHNRRFYEIVRKAQPDLPILIVSKSYGNRPEKISRATYEAAVASGDKAVRFFDGWSFFHNPDDVDSDACTVDGIHPNDLGFYRMYQKLRPVIAELLEYSPATK